MGKVRRIFLFLSIIQLFICFSYAFDSGIVENGNPNIFRNEKKITASIGVYIYPGDTIELFPEDILFFEKEKYLVKALSMSKIGLTKLDILTIHNGIIYFATDKNRKQLHYTYNNINFSLKGSRYILSKENDTLMIYNIGQELEVVSPLSIIIPKHYYTVFNGGTFSMPIKKRVVYDGELPYPFKEKIVVKRSMATTAWLSAIVPGFGHFYANNYIKGVLAVSASLMLMNNLGDSQQKAVYLSLWGWAFIDSLAETRMYNDNLELPDEL